MLSKSYLIGIALISSLSFFQLTHPTSFEIDETRSESFNNFPLRMGAWAGRDEPIDERTVEILETRNILHRIYHRINGDQINLLLVSSNRDRRVAHPPEVCYLSSNFTISDASKSEVDLGSQKVSVKEFTAVHERYPDREQYVLYLYKVGDTFTSSYYSQQLKFAVDQFKQENSEVLLIRIAGNTEASAHSFLKEIVDHIS